MTIKTFTTGEVLTASDTNTYLANSGLVYVTSATVGSGVSSVTVSSAFSSTYDNYRIVYDGGTASQVTDLKLVLGSTATGYYSNMVYSYFGATTVAATQSSNAAYWNYVGGCSANQAHTDFDLYAPFLTKNTILLNANWVQVTTTGGTGKTTGYLADSTSYTAFTLSTIAGTITGGTITVYGYRKA